MRKPKLLKCRAGGCFYDEITGLVINGQGASLNEAKMLSRWLPRMINYLEQKYKNKYVKVVKQGLT